MKRFFTIFLSNALIEKVSTQEQVNVGARYGERFGSRFYADEPIPTEMCKGTEIPNCLFSMDISRIEVSFNREEETLQGFRTTFIE